MDLYKIHGDTGGNWRIDKFVRYCEKDINDTLAPMDFLLSGDDADLSDRIWMSLLYSTCYCLGTAWFLYQSLNYKTLTPKELDEFWAKYRAPLIFQSDRRYVKNMNWFVPIVKEFMKRTKRDPAGYFKQLLTGSPKEVYAKMYKEVNSWRYYGRFSTILFLKTLISIIDVKMDFDTEYDWANGDTTTAGALVLGYRDEEAKKFLEDGKLTAEQKEYFDELLTELRRRMPWDNMLHTTSALCSYFKLYKQTRYVGYYVDRGQVELTTLQANLPGAKELWGEVWTARAETIPHQFLGEVQGWKGIRNDLFPYFAETGKLFPKGGQK